ncbi:MAG: 16S rRNA (uracil(1498)-N(3))-methyltransferase [Eubacteriales bacterium]|nr:16S rRNA (uracil(1498)-N(3))-methyltransferase [Eubacteriales bacterium]
MYHFFVSPGQIKEKEIWIEGSDVKHIRNVLRMTSGEQITVSSREDKGKEYRCQLAELEEQRVTAKIMWVEESDRELPSKICLLQGLPKGDKMELIIQKAVELGVYEIVPVATRRAVVKLDKKKEEAKLRRWNAVAESAAKQSKRRIIPEVKGVMSFRDAAAYAAENYDRRLIPYELAQGMDHTRELFGDIKPGESVAVFIGPEGGFEEEEVVLAREHGICPVTLGKRILRTETAGMTVLSVLMVQLEA